MNIHRKPFAVAYLYTHIANWQEQTYIIEQLINSQKNIHGWVNNHEVLYLSTYAIAVANNKYTAK